ncbi:MAG TPA: hypothetical protein VFF81_10165 [Noviherbaspirillum sp.]|nr:hypothetical protein [Noviherbaspirillum sp.]
MPESAFDVVSLGKFADCDFCEIDYLGEDWEEAIHRVHTPDEAVFQIVGRLCALYCFMQPDKTSDNFQEQVYKPVAAGKHIQIEVGFSSEQSNTTYKTFFNFIWGTCFYAAKAQQYITEGEMEKAWIEVAKANYKLGALEGLILVEPAISHTISARSASGAQKRDAKFEPLRKLARELATKHNYPSKRNAALSIKEQILKQAKELGTNLSEDQAERTITKWLDGIAFTPKR